MGGSGVPVGACNSTATLTDIYVRTDVSPRTRYLCSGSVWVLDAGGGGITNSAGNNVITKSDGTNLIASQISDNGTDVSLSTGGLNLVAGGKVRFSLNEIAYINTLGPTFFDGTINRTWRLNIQGLSATRTHVVPDANGTLPLLELAQTWTAAQANSTNGALSLPADRLTGTPITGGTGTTTFPLFDIATAGATARTAQSTAGTMFGVNAPNAFTGNLIDLSVGGTNVFKVASGGAIQGTSIALAASGFVQYGNRGFHQAAADGVYTFFNNAGSDFNRLQFGGTTSSFPALKRSGTTLQHRLADDSADGPMSASNGTFSGTLTVGGATVSTTIASGTSALGTSAIASATCASVVTTAATGTATTDVVSWGFNGDPTAVTGYVPLTSGMLTIIAYPSVNNVNYKVCNNTTASITPGAITLNWRIVR